MQDKTRQSQSTKNTKVISLNLVRQQLKKKLLQVGLIYNDSKTIPIKGISAKPQGQRCTKHFPTIISIKNSMEVQQKQDCSFPLGFQLFSHRELFSDAKEVFIGNKKISAANSPRAKVARSFKNSFESNLLRDVFNRKEDENKLPKILRGREAKIETERCQTIVIQALEQSQTKVKVFSPKSHQNDLNKRSKTEQIQTNRNPKRYAINKVTLYKQLTPWNGGQSNEDF